MMSVVCAAAAPRVAERVDNPAGAFLPAGITAPAKQDGGGPPCNPAEASPIRGKPTGLSLSLSHTTLLNALLLCAAIYLVDLGIDDFRDRGRVSLLNWDVLARSFSGATLLRVFSLWGLCHAAPLAANLGLRAWRGGPQGGAAARCVWDGAWLAAALALYGALVALPAWAVYRVDLPASAACALGFEQVRLLMKTHAYVREHARGATNRGLGHLFYYLFAPTLVYRDSYPRADRVRPWVVLRHSAQFLASIYVMVVSAGLGALRPFCGGADAGLLDAWCPGADAPGVRFACDYGVILVRALPAGGVLCAGASLALHSWHKVFAEVLRFGDGHLTQAWWNASSYADFLRDWNLFVKAWLHKYVFRELRGRGLGMFAAKMATVAVSALAHEYVLAVSLGYVVPFCAAIYLFGAGLVLSDPLRVQKKARGNLFLLLTLSGGAASFLTLYFMESTARINCPQTLELPWDLFVPRFWACEHPLRNCTFI